MAKQHIEDLFEDKARQGDGSFAIAYALLKLATESGNISYQLGRLGLAEAATPMGAVELLSLQLKETGEGIADALQAIADRE
jgi:hypothetical protein